MQVNKINNVQNFKAGYEQRVLRGALKDNSEAVVRISFDKATRAIKSMEAYQFKNGMCVGGKGEGNTSGFSDEAILKFFNGLQENAKEGTNFFKELTGALFRG